MQAGRSLSASVLDRRSLFQGIGALALLGGISAPGPRIALAQNASGAANRLKETLALIPSSMMLLPDIAASEVTWVDVTAQFEALGTTAEAWVTDPTSFANPFSAMVGRKTRIDMAARHNDFIAAYGFSPLSAQQVLTFGAEPTNVAIYHGGLDRAAIESAITRSGYQPAEGSWTLPLTDATPGATPVGAFPAALAGQDWGTITFLNDNTLLTTRDPQQAQDWLTAMKEDGATFADTQSIFVWSFTILDPATANITTLAPTLLDPGQAATDEISALLDQSDDAMGPLRSVAHGFLTLPAGALAADAPTVTVPESQVSSLLLRVPRSDDREAIGPGKVADIIIWRLTNLTSPVTGKPYIDMLGNPTITTTSGNIDGTFGDTSIVFAFDNTTAATALWEMYQQGDVVPFTSRQ